jgi:hypothetical protein
LETALCVLACKTVCCPARRAARTRSNAPDSLLGEPRAAKLDCILKINCGFRRHERRAGAGKGAAMNDFVIHAASYLGPEGFGNDQTGLRAWPAPLRKNLARGELDGLHWSLLSDSDPSRFCGWT